MILPVLVAPDPQLRLVAKSVTAVTDEIRQLIADMKETMTGAGAVGLAAPQVGQSLRVIVVRRSPDRIVAFINPTFVIREGCQKGQEGCLSVPGVWVDKERAQRIVVRALNERGDDFQVDAKGVYARIIQHECDHLDGILMTGA